MDCAAEPDGPAKAAHYTVDQIRDAMSAMSPSDKAKVVSSARWLAPRTELPWEDLVQEAYLRALDTRTCEVGTPLVAFLIGIMKSIASEGPRSKRKAELGGLEIVYSGNYGDEGLPDVAASGASPEDAALSRTLYAPQLAKAEACIADDEPLQFLVAGLFDGMRGEELEEFVGVDTKGLAAAKKRLGRKVETAFPNGMKL